MNFWIMGTVILVITISIPTTLYVYGMGSIHDRHIQLTTDQKYIQSMSCDNLKGNETSLESVALYDVTQLKDDIKNLEKEKGCN